MTDPQLVWEDRGVGTDDGRQSINGASWKLYRQRAAPRGVPAESRVACGSSRVALAEDFAHRFDDSFNDVATVLADRTAGVDESGSALPGR